LNYFNYFTEVEDTFVRRRAKHLLLSSIDWALIESWKEMGIPLHVVLRGIEKAFDSWESKPRKRSVKTLLYCQEEVEAQYAEWLEARVGAAPSEDATTNEGVDGGDVVADLSGRPARPSLPFPRANILAHLRTARERIIATVQQRNAAGSDDISEALARAAALLDDLEKEFATATQPDAQKLEVSLTGIERLLSDTLSASAPAAEVEAIGSEIKKQLRPYRGHMDAAVYEQTLNNLLLKRLREQFGVPRLSLFYL
jgi:hypothetical protein